MRTQVHNEGELKELKVEIEKQVVDDYHLMAKNTDFDLNELVVIALKRYRASHCDYLKSQISTD